MIIGKNWHTKTLADPNDRVRIEIEAALNRKNPNHTGSASMERPCLSRAICRNCEALTHMRPIDLLRTLRRRHEAA